MKQAVAVFFLCVSVFWFTAGASQPLAGDNVLTQEAVVCPLAEPVRVGVYNWPASQVMTGVLRRLLELAYGCPVEVLEGVPHSLEVALVRGDIDVLIGVSSVSASMPLRDALAAGDVVTTNVLYQQQAGFFVSETVYAALAEGQVSELAQRLLLSVPSADVDAISPTGLDVPLEDVSLEDVVADTASSTAEQVADETGETNAPVGDDAANDDAANDDAASIAANEAVSGEATVTSATTSAATNPDEDASTTEDTSDSAPDSAPDVTSAVADDVQNATSVAAANLLATLPSAFVNCPTRWQCHEINTSKLTAYGFDISVATPESAAAVVATLQTAQREQQPWFGFLWTPSWLVPTFSLVRLAEPTYSDACWQAERACAYPADDVLALWRPEFAAQLPEDMRVFFEQMQFADVLSELLAVQQQAMSNASEATAEDAVNTAVAHFLRSYPEQWQAWLEPVVAARVSSAIQSSTPSADIPTVTDAVTDEDVADIAATSNENTGSERAMDANEDTADQP